MSPTDVKTGNWIQSQTSEGILYGQVDRIDTKSFGVSFKDMPSGHIRIGAFEPIPFTEEWLVRFGFEDWGNVPVNQYESFRRFVLFNTIDGTSNFEVHIITSNYGETKEKEIVYSIDTDRRLYRVKNPQYLHVLQNTYALFGGELTLK